MTDAPVPTGGTTGLSHEHSDAIDHAAQFLAITPLMQGQSRSSLA